MQRNENRFIEELYREYYPKLLTYAKLWLIDTSVSDDMVQDTFHEAVSKINIIMQHPAPEKWLRSTLKNKIRNYEKSRMRMLKHLIFMDDGIEQFPSPDFVEEQVVKAEAVSPLLQIQAFLGDEDFYFLKKITLEKVSHKDMAKELNITVWASAKRLSRIREKLSNKFPDFKKFD